MMLDLNWDLAAFTQSLCLALLHSLWQGALWCAALAIVLQCVPTSRANARYAASLACFLGLAIGVCITLSILRLPQLDRGALQASNDVSASVQVPQIHQAANSLANTTSSSEARETDLGVAGRSQGRVWLKDFAPVLIALWAAGAICFMIKSVSGWRAAQRLCLGESISDPVILELFAPLKQRLGVRRMVGLIRSSSASGPFVLGILQPMIIIPASLASGLTPDQWTMILGHELAHIRRWDYLVNLLQLLIEALLFFNPAVWWLSRQVRIEREACCDACAARLLESPVSYATALMEIGQRLSPSPALAFAAKDSHSLLDRIGRIVGAPVPSHMRFRWPVAVALLLLGIALIVLVQRGSDFAVTAAAQALSDQQRVSQLNTVAEEVAPSSMDTTPKIIRGSITVENDDLPPAIVYVTSHVHRDSSSYTKSEEMTTGKSLDFEYELGSGVAWLVFQSPEHAPAIAGPFNKTPESPIVITLKRGVSASVRLIDENNKPVHGAIVSVFIQVGTWGCGQNFAPGQSDADGKAILSNIDPDQTIGLSITAPGFQQKSINNIKLNANQVLEVQLNSAALASGVVTDTDGKPVQGAELFTLRKQSLGSTHIEGWAQTAMAITDDQGKFSLDALADGTTYDFAVLHPTHGIAFLRGVASGQQSLSVQLPREAFVEVTLHGSDEQIARLKDTYISFGIQPIEDAKYRSDPLQIYRTGSDMRVGNDLTKYKIPGVDSGTLTIRIGEQDYVERITDGQTRLDIELRKPQQPQQRTVQIKFTQDDKAVTPSGKLKLTLQNLTPTLWNQTETLSLVDGVATLQTRVPCQLTISSDQLIGFARADQDFAVDIPAGTDNFPVTIPVQPAGAVKGHVTNADGTPAVDASISVHCKVGKTAKNKKETSFSIFVKTNAQGEFFASPIPFGSQCHISAEQNKNIQLGGSFTIDSQHPIADQSLQFGKTVSLAARVVDSLGNPIRGMPVSIHFEHPDKSQSWSPPEITTANGEITIREVNAATANHFRAKAEPQRDYQVTSVQLVAGQVTELRLMPGMVIEGQLLDAAGVPLAGREMWAVSNTAYDRFPAEARSDAQGHFRFSNLASGEFTLQSSGDYLGNDKHPSQAASSATPIIVKAK